MPVLHAASVLLTPALEDALNGTLGLYLAQPSKLNAHIRRPPFGRVRDTPCFDRVFLFVPLELHGKVS